MLVEIPHGLDVDAARRLVDELFARHAPLYPRHGPELQWLDAVRARFAVLVRGQRVEGTLTLAPGRATLEAALPWPLQPLRALAARIVRQEAERLLAQAGNAG